MKTRFEEPSMDNQRLGGLLAYLDRLTALEDANAFTATREIAECIVEIRKELAIGPWEKAKTHNVAAGVHIEIDDGHGNVIRIEGPASVSVLPLGDRG